MAMKKYCLGWIRLNSWSRYWKILRTSSFWVSARFTPSLLCVQLWMIPFMSKYRLSTVGSVVSLTGAIVQGYLSEIHLKNLGTPMFLVLYVVCLFVDLNLWKSSWLVVWFVVDDIWQKFQRGLAAVVVTVCEISLFFVVVMMMFVMLLDWVWCWLVG